MSSPTLFEIHKGHFIIHRTIAAQHNTLLQPFQYIERLYVKPYYYQHLSRSKHFESSASNFQYITELNPNDLPHDISERPF